MLFVGSPHARPYLLSPECTVKDADAAHAVGTDYTKSRWWVNLGMPVCGEYYLRVRYSVFVLAEWRKCSWSLGNHAAW
jgi:hypothetical protein